MIIKTFDYKGQMINYFNKVVENPKIANCWSGFEVGKGWVITYTYKK